MKFDYCIGNPPYQGDKIGDNSRDEPVYHDFMEEVYKVSYKTMLITPARFLFNAGATSKKWNKKMLNDSHFKVMYYEPNSSVVFPNTDIKGGVAITYRNQDADYGAIDTFTPYLELNSILKKINPSLSALGSLADIAYASTSYSFTEKMHLENPNLEGLFSKGHKFDIDSNSFERLEGTVLYNKEPKDKFDYIQLYGRKDNKRIYQWIKKDYVKDHPNLYKWKVIVAKSNGNGKLGEVLSNPEILGPGIGHTRTFMSFGAFETKCEAENLLKYIKSKFARCLLGVLKVTQDNPVSVWKKIPLEDFSKTSDIDWKQDISNIDTQLYKKYLLADNDIEFIKTHIKEME